MTTTTIPAGPAPFGLRLAYLVAWLVLTAGVALSFAANILAAPDGFWPRVFYAVVSWVFFLSLTMLELLLIHGESERRPWMALVCVGVVTVVAGWMSYGHITELVHGWDPDNAELYPILVEGAVLAASAVIHDGGTLLNRHRSATGHQAGPGSGTEPAPVPQPDGVTGPAVDRSAPTAELASTEPTPTFDTPTVNTAADTPAVGVSKVGPRGFGSKVRAVRSAHPDWSAARIADHVGCAPDTARRHLRTTPDAPAVGPTGSWADQDLHPLPATRPTPALAAAGSNGRHPTEHS